MKRRCARLHGASSRFLVGHGVGRALHYLCKPDCARWDLCGGYQVTGIPTAMLFGRPFFIRRPEKERAS
jgi:hypothetical protein